MADELKNKLYVIGSIVALVIAAAGGWTAVVVGRTDITLNTETNVVQDGKIKENTKDIGILKTNSDVHKAESLARQKNIEKLQLQVEEGIKEGNKRFIEILERLPKKE